MRERKHSASQQSRRLLAEARRDRRLVRQARHREIEARETALRAALARQPDSPARVVDRLLEGAARTSDPKLRELLLLVVERAPRLVRPHTLAALKLVAETSWVRPPAEWRPSGKGGERLFRSLCEHVLARHRMPSVVWSAFTATTDAPALSRVAVHVAAGGSLYAAVKSGLLPVPLTRAMCHDLLARGGEAGFLDAVRRAQVRAAGGDARLHRAWVATRAGSRLHDAAGEAFWYTVLVWLGANPMLPAAEVGPLVDYIDHRRGEDPGFSMKRRSVLAVMRGMREWHGDLARQSAASGRVFPPSGFQPMDLDRSRRSVERRRVVEVWHVREVLDARTLADEGRAMGHCVFSYARSIERRECSIWTLTLEDDTGHWRRLTIEVRPALRQIVQARGRFNRMPDAHDRRALDEWAVRNDLQVCLGR
jgi:PcfJ-like protein